MCVTRATRRPGVGWRGGEIGPSEPGSGTWRGGLPRLYIGIILKADLELVTNWNAELLKVSKCSLPLVSYMMVLVAH